MFIRGFFHLYWEGSLDKIACLLNSPNLGGAERSFLIQLSILKLDKLEVMAPVVGDVNPSNQLSDFSEELGFKLVPFDYNQKLYKTSRSSRFNLIEVVTGLFEQVLYFKSTNIYEKGTLWCNGNKVFLPIFLGAILFGYRGKVLWHLRDFPTGGKLFSFLGLLYKMFGHFEWVLIGNSDSVLKSYQNKLPFLKGFRVYNPVSEPIEKGVGRTGIVGFAGMSAPWKGLHELYLWASLYEDELVKSGINEVALYGENIYLTEGTHSAYGTELKKLQDLFPNSIVQPRGLKKPEEIYSEIDLMLHLSNQPEPFGRVILESFSYGVPIISTRIGGSRELFAGSQEEAHIPYDYAGLTEKVVRLMTDAEARNASISYGDNRFKELQQIAKSDLETVKNFLFSST